MNNIKKLAKIMLIQWKLMISGLFTMMIFALLSGISVTMAVPLFDYVFGNKRISGEINTFSAFFNKTGEMFSQFFSGLGFSNLFSGEYYVKSLGSLKSILSISDPYLLLMLIGFGMIILIVLKNLFFYLNKIIFVSLRGRSIEHIRNIMFKKYLDLSMNFYKDNKIGDIQVRITSDVSIVSDLFIQSFFGGMRDFTLVIIYVSIALFINPRLFMYVIIIVPIFALSISYIGSKIKKYSKRIQKTYSTIYSKIEEVFNGIKIVKSYSKEEYELNRFKEENRNFYVSWLKSHLYQSLNVPLSEFNGTLTGVVILLIGGKMVLDGNSGLTFGEFTAFLFAIFSILHPLKELTKYYTEIRRALVSLNRVFEILNREPNIKELQGAVAKKEFTNSIKISDLSFSYESKKVLKSINLEIRKGEKIAIVGVSGGGKTTLVNLIERFYDPCEGSIYIDGTDIRNIKVKDLHDLFGTVTQESILFNDTVENNIRYGSNKEITLEDVKKAAVIAYADDFIQNIDKGYQTMLSPKASNLSGGQRQRLCIARAIVGDPPILIFDEATSSLDSEAELNVQKAIEMATKDRTVIVIAHRLSTILNSDKIVVMDKGEIIGTGKHKDLLENNEKYKKLYEIQFNDNGNVS
ncbi:MAG TPA: ABC transporter ATP-binding protein [Clostridiales bacterium]|nr:ABC transporter ATP-binding protein [Clostridiales bacterium]HQP69020.1 ABC transporter ATP-binding protein [Clostridiales bacterium]